MKMRYLHQRLERVPMVRVAACFAAGVAAAEAATLPVWWLAAVAVAAGTMALLGRSSAWTAVLLFVAGFAARQLHNRPCSVPVGVRCAMEIIVDGIPADRGRHRASDATVRVWREESGAWHAAGDRLLLRADSLTPLAGGERLLVVGTIRPVRGAGSYRRLMARRGFAGTLYLDERAVLERSEAPHAGLHGPAARRLLEAGLRGDAGAVVRAMTVADRSGLEYELRAAYSRSGMAHLLAVSGLHTGLVFLVANLLLAWLPLARRGFFLRSAAATAAVWLFVAAAGFPASAVRAGIMCTLLQASLFAGTTHAALNALGTAAFGMLAWNPMWIGDIGFQLSFAAVGAILVWGVPLSRRLRTGIGIVDAATGTLVAGLAASAGTAPLVAHAFGIVPVAGLLLNPLVIPTAGVAVAAGALLVVMPAGWLSGPLVAVAEGAAGLLNAAAETCAALPFAALEVTLPGWATAACYAAMAAATAAGWCAEPKKSVSLKGDTR